MKWLCYAVICHLCSLGCLAMSQSEIEDFSNFLRQTSSLDQNLKSKIIIFFLNIFKIYFKKYKQQYAIGLITKIK